MLACLLSPHRQSRALRSSTSDLIWSGVKGRMLPEMMFNHTIVLHSIVAQLFTCKSLVTLEDPPALVKVLPYAWIYSSPGV